MIIRSVLSFLTLTIFVLAGSVCAMDELKPLPEQKEFKEVLNKAKRSRTSDGWFEVIEMPNNIYAFWEPGHLEQVSSYLILGETLDLLYDTGMGIASIKNAIAEVRKAEGLPERDIMVLNSHAHLDHIGDNHEFDEIYGFNHEWRIRKITEGIPAGNEKWIDYFSSLTGTPRPPENYSPATMSIPPVSRGKIKFINDRDIIDLGNRKFTVILSRSHTEESLILYDADNKLLFTGDVFSPAIFGFMDFEALYKDLLMLNSLDVAYHYDTHGPYQLIDLSARSKALKAFEKVRNNEVEPFEMEFFVGDPNQVYEVDDIQFWYWPHQSMY